MRLTRVIAKLEPGGAQLGVLRITGALKRLGVETRVLAGQATREGRRMFAAAGVAPEVWSRGDARVQSEPRPAFADWLAPRLADADLVHAHAFGAWWAAARAVPPRTPLVASDHGRMHPPADAYRAEMRSALERVDLLFAHGPSARTLFAELGVGPDRLRAGASAIDRIDARPLRGLPFPRLVFAGRLHAERGPDLLLEALALLPSPPATLLLGAGPLERRLRRMARRRGIDRSVRFVGWHPDVARFLAGASACVVPSRHDAWSQTAVQAMGLGVPVIAAAVEGLPAAIGSNRGVLVPPEDPEALATAIQGVLAGDLPVDREEARAYAQRFTPDRVARAYADEYHRLLERDAREAA
jgi:glycosyltransferase involved in cell wall biosynthesis